ncbi:MAG: hypothetical protein D6719_02095 [Candidatus Dadabacteria bacterium]|nr:MAG: hypothetical protein D6719_02095 [Candidatus Dadabacteria bacterium]
MPNLTLTVRKESFSTVKTAVLTDYSDGTKTGKFFDLLFTEGSQQALIGRFKSRLLLPRQTV